MDARKLKITVFAVLGLISVAIGVSIGLIAVQSADLPEISVLEKYRPSATSRVFSDDGELIAEFYMQKRYPVSLDQIPAIVKQAFLDVEDPRFYSHSGIDLVGIMRAMLHNLKAGRIEQGGSTITQQLAKILFLKPERTYTRKFNEALLALQIEKRYSKDEILNIYLNQVYLGSGAYGVEAASRIYFGKSVEDLTIGEAAMLAGLPQAPSRYSPLVSLEAAKARRRHSLKRMLAEGHITQEQMRQADEEPILKEGSSVEVTKAPYFVEYIRQNLQDRFGTGTLYTGGLNIYTTLNLKLQDIAEQAILKGLGDAMKRHPRKGVQLQGALLAIEPHTGYIKAMVGGTDYAKSQFNRCTQAHRQPGSAFKPIVFAAALDKGYRPDDVVLDIPVSYPGAKQDEVWSPSNFDNDFEGPVTLRRALARSINVVAVRLLDNVGIKNVIQYARNLGINSDMPPYLPLALGATDLTLMEITGAYSTFDNAGVYVKPTAILKITDRDGHVIEENIPVTRQAVSADTAAEITDMLATVVKHGTGWQARELGRPLAGKTGTTSDYNDAWFVGYVPSLALGVWVGYDDHKPMGKLETGARAALPIWIDFMKGYFTAMKVPPENFPPLPPPSFANRSGLSLRVDAVGVKYYDDNVPDAPDEHADETDQPVTAGVPEEPKH
jgi:1A family penicillin-binding protein